LFKLLDPLQERAEKDIITGENGRPLLDEQARMLNCSNTRQKESFCLVEAERWASAAAGSGSAANAVGSQLHAQTVSKPRFWSLLTFQTIDFVRPHFRKIEF
jgi:hypothetical protein